MEPQTPLYLKDFLTYNIENNYVKPIKKFKARAAVMDKPPRTFTTLPLGDVIIYPKFLVFLTLQTCSPGYSLFFKEVLLETISQINLIFKLNEIQENPSKILKEIGQWISEKYIDTDKLEKSII